MAAELRHFWTYQNGPQALAKVEFSDLGPVVHVRVVVDMEIKVGSLKIWDNFNNEVQGLLKYSSNTSRLIAKP